MQFDPDVPRAASLGPDQESDLGVFRQVESSWMNSLRACVGIDDDRALPEVVRILSHSCSHRLEAPDVRVLPIQHCLQPGQGFEVEGDVPDGRLPLGSSRFIVKEVYLEEECVTTTFGDERPDIVVHLPADPNVRSPWIPIVRSCMRHPRAGEGELVVVLDDVVSELTA